MEAALTAILTNLVLQIGEDAALFLTTFIGGFVKLRLEKGGKGLILPQLIHWWMIAADTQKHDDGTPYTGEEKHAYVLGIMDTWAKNVGLDLSSSFKDALIKIGMIKRLQDAGKEAVQVVAEVAGEKIKKETQSAVKK